MKPATIRQPQQGLSLLELLVSMTIGLIVIFGMLSVYKSSARVTAETRLGANIDGQIATALLMADRALQNAGYSYSSGSAYGTYLQVYNGTTAVASGTTGTALVWMASATACQALVASGNGLILYGSPTNYSCNSPSLPTAGNASQTVLITAPTVSIPNASSAGSTTIIVTANSATTCAPFGIASGGVVASGGAYSATLLVTGYGGGNIASSTTCLFNYH